MLYKKVKLSALIFLFLGLTELYAQEATPATGGNATGSGGNVSYTIGQPVYTTNSGINGSVAQGVQQPYEISIIIGIDETKRISLEYSVYPNPTTANIRLKVDNFEFTTLSYQLCDMNGKIVETNKVESKETLIQMGNLAKSTYFLTITNGEKVIKSFKIIII